MENVLYPIKKVFGERAYRVSILTIESGFIYFQNANVHTFVSVTEKTRFKNSCKNISSPFQSKEKIMRMISVICAATEKRLSNSIPSVRKRRNNLCASKKRCFRRE